MEINLQGVEQLATAFDVTRAIATVLHSPEFVGKHHSLSRPVNFLVILAPDKAPNSIRNGGTGILTLPNKNLGDRFLYYLRKRNIKIKVNYKAIRFLPTQGMPSRKILHTLRMVPYQDPTIIETKEKIIASLKDEVCVRKLQFGVLCREPPVTVFSPEYEQDYTHKGDSRLVFEYEHKLLRFKTGDHTDTDSDSVVITFANLKRIEIGWEYGEPFIIFYLTAPAALESESMYRLDSGRPWEDGRRVRRRVGFFDEAHRRVAPYAHQLRLVVKMEDDLDRFDKMCHRAGILKVIRNDSLEVSCRNIFSHNNLRKIEIWLESLDWPVAFQCQALLCNLRINAVELLKLKPKIDSLARQGSEHASGVLRHFHTVLRSLRDGEDIDAAFTRAVSENKQLLAVNQKPVGMDSFDARHVSFTPTAMRLEGPYTHQSNTVLRKYVDYQEFFVRVDFRDEDRLQYRWDREVDGATFVKERVGNILKHGFTIAGRKFEFLAYSQSQLRSHSVFFVAPFQHPIKGWVTASTIRDELGVFDNIIQFPALYAARISQAFSGTETSVRLRLDQWEEVEDVRHHNRCFTDGVGTISPELAKAIWQSLCKQRRRTSTAPFIPAAFQIRFGGYKGMVAVDPRLTGIWMRLRGSMKKFDTHNSDDMPLEIARAFEYPGRMYLNRPLIQIMEDLGIPRQAFMELQEAAVTDVQTARHSLANFTKLLDSHGLGKAFSLSYLLQSLEKIGCDFEHHDQFRALATPFVRGIVDVAIVSVLRDMKHKARIPVPQGWNLVGVADESGGLGPGQIYACIWELGMEKPMYLKGPVVISRSPTIHAGDVQMVWAVGKPPPGSMYAVEPLPNVVVFPCEGKRDIPSCLAGGDLDGDLYLVCRYQPLLLDPTNCHPPGDYPPTERLDIGRPSTMHDVADFVVEYINSDVVGLLSTNHLILSDQSPFGARDHGCLKLAELCSKAVDFPKSGIPVNMQDTPRFLIPNKPDWKSDEVIDPRRTDYYESTRAIGYLYRAIKLEENATELSFDPKTFDLKEKPDKEIPSQPVKTIDAISATLGPTIEPYVQYPPTHDLTLKIRDIFSKYSMELQYICMTHTLSHDPDIRLREEEVVVGTILAKCVQARWRADRVEQMRINASRLVRIVSGELLESLESASQRLAKGWAAWKYSRANCSEFGHQSFGLIALEIIFRALEDLKGEDTA